MPGVGGHKAMCPSPIQLISSSSSLESRTPCELEETPPPPQPSSEERHVRTRLCSTRDTMSSADQSSEAMEMRTLLDLPDELLLAVCWRLCGNVFDIASLTVTCARLWRLMHTTAGAKIFEACARAVLNAPLVRAHMIDAETVRFGVTRRALWWRKLAQRATVPCEWTVAAPRLEIRRSAPVVAHGHAPGRAPSGVSSSSASAAVAPPFHPDIHTARSGHTATLLDSGMTLIVGGASLGGEEGGWLIVLEPLIIDGSTVYPARQRGWTRADGVGELFAGPREAVAAWEAAEDRFQGIGGPSSEQQRVPEVPPPRLRHAACRIGPSALLLHGGMNMENGEFYEDLWIGEVRGDASTGFEVLWRPYPVSALAAHTARSDDDGDAVSLLWNPGPRCQHTLSLTPDGHRVILVGGRGVPLSPAAVLDLASGCWHTTELRRGNAEPPNMLQLHHAIVSVERNELVIFGGGDSDTLVEGVHSDEDPVMSVYTLNLDTYEWRNVSSQTRDSVDVSGSWWRNVAALVGAVDAVQDVAGGPPSPVDRAGYEAIGPGHALVFGGQDRLNGRFSRGLHVLDLRSYTWQAVRLTYRFPRDYRGPQRVAFPVAKLWHILDARAGPTISGLCAFSGLDDNGRGGPTLYPSTKLLQFRLAICTESIPDEHPTRHIDTTMLP